MTQAVVFTCLYYLPAFIGVTTEQSRVELARRDVNGAVIQQDSIAAGPASVKSLAARYYTDEGTFKHEQQGLLASTWQLADYASMLKKTGDYFAFEIAGQSLFCVRDKSGAVNTFYNVCQHLAHELVSGCGNARTLTCPYHAWTYELSSELKTG